MGIEGEISKILGMYIYARKIKYLVLFLIKNSKWKWGGKITAITTLWWFIIHMHIYAMYKN